MKKFIFILLLLSGKAFAQNWQDSTIQLQLTQRFAWWAAKGLSLTWENRKLPDVLKNYVGSGTRPDSTFTVTLKAGIIRDAMELLLTRPMLLAYNDYRSIMLNQPAISGYTRLDTQITTKANQGDGAAIWLRDWYQGRVATFDNLYNEEKNNVLKLVQ